MTLRGVRHTGREGGDDGQGLRVLDAAFRRRRPLPAPNHENSDGVPTIDKWQAKNWPFNPEGIQTPRVDVRVLARLLAEIGLPLAEHRGHEGVFENTVAELLRSDFPVLAPDDRKSTRLNSSHLGISY